MKLLLAPFLLCLLFVHSTSCNGPKELPSQQIEDEASDASERSFIMGSGGGITGAYTTYRVHRSGRVEEEKGIGQGFSFFKELPSDSAKACFDALDALDLTGYAFHHPGNMTYFIEQDSTTITWGDARKAVRADVDRFFKRSRKMIRADYNR